MRFYKDAELYKDRLQIRSTDMTIPLDRAMIKSLARGIALYFFVYGVYFLRKLNFRRKRLTIGFYPHEPKPWYKIWNYTKYFGVKYSSDYRDCDALIFFEDKTLVHPPAELPGAEGRKVLNARCTNIGKDHVEHVFQSVFGYSLSVDPRTFEGRMVRKSVENAAHDGTIIEGPVSAPEPGKVYQRLVDNSYDGRFVQDIRVPIIGGRIPFLYIKERPIETRFANENSASYMLEVRDALSEREAALCREFAERMGMDIGGLDVLRDRCSGLIYIVDVNKTDMGPPVPLSFTDKIRALHRLGKSFIAMVEREKAAEKASSDDQALETQTKLSA